MVVVLKDEVTHWYLHPVLKQKSKVVPEFFFFFHQRQSWERAVSCFSLIRLFFGLLI